MKPLPFKIPRSTHHSLRRQTDDQAFFYDRLHYHPEWQITLILKSEGTLFVGNGMHRFKEGDIFCFGSNLPHLFKNDPLYYSAESPGARSFSIFFDLHSFGQEFFNLPELKAVKSMLFQANKGISFPSESTSDLANRLTGLAAQEGFPLLLQFFDLLEQLSQHKPWQFLSNMAYDRAQAESAGKRMDEVLQFIFKHYDRSISIKEAAEAANLSVPAFCKYFKLHTRKTFISYLNEVRINAACKLLIDEDFSIGQIAYRVGFNNLSNFNRQFKKLKGLTPSAYQQVYP